MDIVINTAADAVDALVESQTNNTTRSMSQMFVGDVVSLKITFTDGNGGLAHFTGNAGVAILCAIGVLQSRTAYTTTGTLSEDGQGYLTTLDLGTQQLKDAINGLETLDLTFEVQASFHNGTTETLLQKTVEMRQQLVE